MSHEKQQRQLDPLLASEVEKRLPLLDADRDIMEVRAALHSLKGSLAMAGSPRSRRARTSVKSSRTCPSALGSPSRMRALCWPTTSAKSR